MLANKSLSFFYAGHKRKHFFGFILFQYWEYFFNIASAFLTVSSLLEIFPLSINATNLSGPDSGPKSFLVAFIFLLVLLTTPLSFTQAGQYKLFTPVYMYVSFHFTPPRCFGHFMLVLPHAPATRKTTTTTTTITGKRKKRERIFPNNYRIGFL